MEDFVSPSGRRYAALKDTPDQRDMMMAPEPVEVSLPWYKRAWQYFFPPATAETKKLEKVDLSPFLGPVKNQGDLGACTGFAYAGYREYLYRKFFQYEKDKTIPADKMVFSPLFIYYEERALEGTINEDSGAEMRDGCRVLNSVGVCPEKDDPYIVKNFKIKPDPSDYEHALKYKAGAYHRLRIRLDEVKSCIRSGYPVAAGILVYESFESESTAKTGIVPLPNPKREKLYGGHAILMVGFDDKKQLIKCRNSWGAEWGDGGFFYLPYSFISVAFVNDMWMIHLGPAWKPKQ